MELTFEHHTWAEIDLDALEANFRIIQKQAGEMPLCAVVKADSYGHGAVRCAEALAEAGAAWFAVSCLAEALQLRRAGLTQPILILGHTEPAFAAELIAHNITQACFSAEYAQALSAAAETAGGKVNVHLKADTGMGRIGFAVRTDFEKAIAEMCAVCALPGLKVTGLFQHFAVADSAAAADKAYTEEQQLLFNKVYQALKAAGHEPAVVHCDNSAGVMLHPDWPLGLPRAHCMARPGIILYGFDPSSEVRFSCFRPVMRLKTVVSMVKTMQPGQSTSYGRHFVAEAPTRVATLCVGYADGYPRLLSCGKGIVELHGKPAKVLGNVCMDQIMVDVTDIPEVRPGDEAIVWGGAVSDSAETIADKTGTISYEVLCGVARRVPRVYLRGGKIVAVESFLNG
ncbi:MAG: alanine racemase [Faecalibacterium sp.]|jgi:alanine racemase|nr:alanine racemase [Faecalibacterium sp.]